MRKSIFIYIIGTAGSGKTYLTKALTEWFDLKNVDNITVNLDPGVEILPYTPDVDIREWITLDKVMEKYKVGPNSAQIISADLISTKSEKIKDEIEYYNASYVIIDTPGQMELFTLRQSGEIIVNTLGKKRSVMVYLFDPIVSKTPSGYLSLLFLATSAVFKLNIPQVQVLAKADVLSDEELKRIMRWSENPDDLYNSIPAKSLSNELFYLMKDSGFFRSLIPVSSLTGYGLDDIYDCIQELFYGGEDIQSILF